MSEVGRRHDTAVAVVHRREGLVQRQLDTQVVEVVQRELAAVAEVSTLVPAGRCVVRGRDVELDVRELDLARRVSAGVESDDLHVAWDARTAGGGGGERQREDRVGHRSSEREDVSLDVGCRHDLVGPQDVVVLVHDNQVLDLVEGEDGLTVVEVRALVDVHEDLLGDARVVGDHDGLRELVGLADVAGDGGSHVVG